MANSRYQQGEAIGQGGTGIVYLAMDSENGQQVALKRFHAQLTADSMAVSKQSDEARRASAFNNTNIAKVLEANSDDEGHYTVMEHTPAGSLADRMERSGPLAPTEAIPLVQKMGQALSLCHRTRLIHGNLKPANVLIGPGGDPKLTDFGTIHLALQDELTRELVGTDYLAPELLGEQPLSNLGVSADVYGLTAVLYAALTGESPRSGAAWRVPPHLRLVLQKGLADDPGERYSTVEELLAALNTAARSTTKKGPIVAVAAAVGLAVVGGVLAFALTSEEQPLVQEPAATRQDVAAVNDKPLPVPKPVPPRAQDEAAVDGDAQAQGQVVALNTVATVTGNGYAFAFVENTGSVALEKPRLDLEYFDDQGRSLSKGFGYASFDLVEPGERTPIKVLLKPYPKGHTRHEAKLTIKPPYVKSKRLARLAVVDKSLGKRSYGTSLEAAVTVRNDDSVSLKFIEAIVVLYDDQERIVEIASSFVKEKPLAPGGQGQAKVLLLPKPNTAPSRYQVFLDATVFPR